MKSKTLIAVAATLAMTAGLAQAAGDPAAGQAKTGACVSCHGANGMSTQPIYPNLAGQNEQYLINSIKAYKAGQRTGGTAAIMAPMANLLATDQDIADVAAYYASMKAE